METHIDCKMCGISYGGYKIWSLIDRVQCMETPIEGTMYVVSYGGTTFGDSYIGYNVWRYIYMVQCVEIHIEGTISGDT